MKVIKIKNPNDLIPPLERGCYPRIVRGTVAYLRLDNLTFYIHLLHGDPNIFVIWAGKPRTFSFTTFRYRVFIGSVYDLVREIERIDYNDQVYLANDYYFIHNMHHDSDCFLVWVGHERQFSFARFTPHFITCNAEDVANFIQGIDNEI